MKQPIGSNTGDALDKLAVRRLVNPAAKTAAQRQCEFANRQKFNFLNIFVTRHEK